jgi:hypothetical protein
MEAVFPSRTRSSIQRRNTNIADARSIPKRGPFYDPLTEDQKLIDSICSAGGIKTKVFSQFADQLDYSYSHRPRSTALSVDTRTPADV